MPLALGVQLCSPESTHTTNERGKTTTTKAWDKPVGLVTVVQTHKQVVVQFSAAMRAKPVAPAVPSAIDEILGVIENLGRGKL